MVRLYLPLAPFEKMFVCLAAGIGTGALLTSPAFLGYSWLRKSLLGDYRRLTFLTVMLQNY